MARSNIVAALLPLLALSLAAVGCDASIVGGGDDGDDDGSDVGVDDDGDDDDGDAPSAAAGVGGEDGDTGGGAQASDADEGCAVRAPRQGGRGDAATLTLAGMALAGAIGRLRRRAELRGAERRARGGVR